MRYVILAGGVVLALAIALLVMLRRAPHVVVSEPRPVVIADARAGVAPAVPPALQIPIDARAGTFDSMLVAEHEAMIAKLRASGSGAESWDQQGLTLLESIAHDGVEIDEAGCYIAGCGAAFTFPNEPTFRRRIAELGGSDLYKAWTGGKRVTPPEIGANGRVTIALLLYRPD